jgi:HAD superfamily hydrolase (TIGR01509 family)
MDVFNDFPTLSGLNDRHPALRGVLFDMDGTLFQTEEIHADVLRQMAVQWKIRPPFPPQEVEARLKGMADRQVLAMARSWEGFPVDMDEETFIAEKNRQLLELIPRTQLQQWCAPALVNFLKAAREQGLLLAVVTSSERVITDQLLEVSGLTTLFDLVITLQDVKFAKPHPWPYLQAMLQLGIGPRETVIFEDSAPGLAAAKESGAWVIEAQWWTNYSYSGRRM